VTGGRVTSRNNERAFPRARARRRYSRLATDGQSMTLSSDSNRNRSSKVRRTVLPSIASDRGKDRINPGLTKVPSWSKSRGLMARISPWRMNAFEKIWRIILSRYPQYARDLFKEFIRISCCRRTRPTVISFQCARRKIFGSSVRKYSPTFGVTYAFLPPERQRQQIRFDRHRHLQGRNKSRVLRV